VRILKLIISKLKNFKKASIFIIVKPINFIFKLSKKRKLIALKKS